MFLPFRLCWVLHWIRLDLAFLSDGLYTDSLIYTSAQCVWMQSSTKTCKANKNQVLNKTESKTKKQLQSCCLLCDKHGPAVTFVLMKCFYSKTKKDLTPGLCLSHISQGLWLLRALQLTVTFNIHLWRLFTSLFQEITDLLQPKEELNKTKFPKIAYYIFSTN